MSVIEVIFPVFFVVLIGYTAARTTFISPTDASGIAKFVFNIAIPALLFNSLSKVELPPSFEWQYLVSYYAAVVVVFGLGMLLSKFIFKQRREEQAIFGMGSAYSNSVLVGLPIISAGLGEEALLPLFILISIHTAVLFFLAISVIESDQDGGSRREIIRQVARGLLLNPIIIGLLLGVLANVTGLRLWSPLDSGLELLARASLPCALFVLGASLNNYTLKGNLGKAGLMVVMKLFVHPAVVFVLVFFVFDINLLWSTVAVMTAGMPTGVNSYVLAQKYGLNVPVVSSSILLSTILAAGTQSLMLAVYLNAA